MKRVIVKAFTAHALTLTVEANKFLADELNARLPSLQGAKPDTKTSLEEAQTLLNQLLGSAEKSKCTQGGNRLFFDAYYILVPISSSVYSLSA
jgi:hypothetical protein